MYAASSNKPGVLSGKDQHRKILPGEVRGGAFATKSLRSVDRGFATRPGKRHAPCAKVGKRFDNSLVHGASVTGAGASNTQSLRIKTVLKIGKGGDVHRYAALENGPRRILRRGRELCRIPRSRGPSDRYPNLT